MSAPSELELLHRMLLIRRMEERLGEVVKSGELPGSVHLYIGQEAVAVGVCSNLTEQDWIASTHRGHGHFLAKGVDVALIDLDDAHAALDEGGAAAHVAHSPVDGDDPAIAPNCLHPKVGPMVEIQPIGRAPLPHPPSARVHPLEPFNARPRLHRISLLSARPGIGHKVDCLLLCQHRTEQVIAVPPHPAHIAHHRIGIEPNSHPFPF
jgi:hypothetical protein